MNAIIQMVVVSSCVQIHLEAIICSCNTSFNLRHNSFCADVDECSTGTNNCSRKCVNEIGSFHCECLSDEVLSDDRVSCKVAGGTSNANQLHASIHVHHNYEEVI
ncbi:PREDICTED: EGF-containing fibulin-like extracellular matrix protein 1 [Amphimedon queenslandica]|uniref:EGF-like calcium-binding domain-containing protein n=1 Tax=Amphimedon queenslandica TaxID=400682 RepID=A0AAN0JYK0_AMPQE|nr:PREDICTED: EGF-containing fibulin-like extracellular matrix protein 1 [Amphimedon queenslandica]|eukprot:XP_019861983.1 PREDICTED: EGF-containing fibulin-like extracellular matrix protein 1 [Amphimedon queenslandica]